MSQEILLLKVWTVCPNWLCSPLPKEFTSTFSRELDSPFIVFFSFFFLIIAKIKLGWIYVLLSPKLRLGMLISNQPLHRFFCFCDFTLNISYYPFWILPMISLDLWHYKPTSFLEDNWSTSLCWKMHLTSVHPFTYGSLNHLSLIRCLLLFSMKMFTLTKAEESCSQCLIMN